MCLDVSDVIGVNIFLSPHDLRARVTWVLWATLTG